MSDLVSTSQHYNSMIVHYTNRFYLFYYNIHYKMQNLLNVVSHTMDTHPLYHIDSTPIRKLYNYYLAQLGMTASN